MPTSTVIPVSEESTDDAVVEAPIRNVEARTKGLVARVNVQDNQRVEAGTVLVEIEDQDAKVRKAVAEAELAAEQAKLASVRAGIWLHASPPVRAAEALRERAEIDLRRAEQLHRVGELTESEMDALKAQYDQSVAAVAQARARELTHPAAAQAGPDHLALAQARVAAAEAKVQQADLEISYTRVKAPIAGIVMRRSVEVGQLVDGSRPLMAISATEDAWIVANYKEDQLARIRAGQRVAIDVAVLHGRALTGHVDSVSVGSVVIRIDDKPRDFALLPGMSIHVTVKTARGP
jgi:membrane fusion protein (multidrug efflux system)